jgi:hypothetical protein
MSASKRHVRAGRGFPILAAALFVGTSVTAASLQAAGNDPDNAASASSRLVTLGCDSGAPGANPIVLEGGEIRTVEFCNGVERGGLSETARALSAAMEAEAGKSKIYSHPRMPELLSLRLRRSQAEVDMSLSTDNQTQRLAALNHEIKTLESEIAQKAQVR